MPELIEVEFYRAALAPLIGGLVEDVQVADKNFTRPKGSPPEVFTQLVGESLTATSRRGKLLMLHFGEGGSDGVHTGELTLGMRFGMTGRLLVDGTGPIDKLEYASGRDEPRWDRCVLNIGGKRVAIRDQRRLGSVELDPNPDLLGPEASTVTGDELADTLSGRTKAIKAVLLDQKLLAGLGNLLVDETLWSAGIAPSRAANVFTLDETDALATTIRATVDQLTQRGGSHTGDSFTARDSDATCPRDGEPMRHDTVGGRSTWWCPAHQR